MIKPSDLKTIALFKNDLDKISQYVDQHYSKDKFSKDIVNSSWLNTNKPLNPNFTGIVGEWALASDNEPGLSVVEFLGERPIMLSDSGDGMAFPFSYPRVVNKKFVIFDIKTGGWNVKYRFSLSTANFRALVLKTLDVLGRNKEKDYQKIDAFVFGIFIPDKMQCIFTGWYDKEELFRDAELVDKEFEVSDGKVMHRYYAIPHSQLRPISELTCRGFSRITELTMKDKDIKI